MLTAKELVADRYRDLVEHSHDFICTHDLRGRLLSVNEPAARFLGYSVDELLEMDYNELIVPEYRDGFGEYLRQVTTRGVAKGLVQVQTRIGERRIWEYYNTLRTEGVASPIVRGMAHDITELWRAQHELREQHALLNAVMESTTDAIFVKDSRGSYLMINTAAARLIGRPPDEIVGRDASEVFSTEHAIRVMERDRRIMSSEVPASYEEEFVEEGSTRCYWVSKAPYRDSKGRVMGLVGIARDLTSRKLAETALRSSEEALRRSNRQILDLAGRLITAQEEERRKISRELHDDLNQKLAAASIAMSKLRRDLPEAPDPVKEQVAALQERITSLSDDVRRLSHELHPATLEHLGLTGALKAYCSEFENREGIKIQLSMTGRAFEVNDDLALCLYRVAQESLRNIARHSAATTARITLTQKEGSIELSVADSGKGYNPEQARRKGGLGLISMSERVQLLGGSLEVETEPGKGTTVVARISLGGRSSTKGATQ